MKKLLLLLIFPIFLGSTSKYEYKYEVPFAPILYAGINDSIPTIDQFGRIRNGIIVDNIVSVMNTDPSGVKLTRAELDYIRSIVGGLYVTGMWQRSVAIYGFVGGNAFKHKWNWKDMRDLDAAFRLTFPNGMTHSANGIQGNGVNQYADTKILSSSVLTLNNTHLSIFSTSNTLGSITDIGDGAMDLRISFNGTSFVDFYNNAAYRASSSVNNSLGISLGSITAVNRLRLFKNSDLIASNNNTNTSAFTSTLNLTIGANGGTSQFSNRQYTFASIGSGLTDQQAITSSQVITYSQGILGRQ